MLNAQFAPEQNRELRLRLSGLSGLTDENQSETAV
jgi:hypothetical protein